MIFEERAGRPDQNAHDRLPVGFHPLDGSSERDMDMGVDASRKNHLLAEL